MSWEQCAINHNVQSPYSFHSPGVYNTDETFEDISIVALIIISYIMRAPAFPALRDTARSIISLWWQVTQRYGSIFSRNARDAQHSPAISDNRFVDVASDNRSHLSHPIATSRAIKNSLIPKYIHHRAVTFLELTNTRTVRYETRRPIITNYFRVNELLLQVWESYQGPLIRYTHRLWIRFARFNLKPNCVPLSRGDKRAGYCVSLKKKKWTVYLRKKPCDNTFVGIVRFGLGELVHANSWSIFLSLSPIKLDTILFLACNKFFL